MNQTKKTAQGVRNINGKNFDGGGYNGRGTKGKKIIACPHALLKPEYGEEWDLDASAWTKAYVGERCTQCNQVLDPITQRPI